MSERVVPETGSTGSHNPALPDGGYMGAYLHGPYGEGNRLQGDFTFTPASFSANLKGIRRDEECRVKSTSVGGHQTLPDTNL